MKVEYETKKSDVVIATLTSGDCFDYEDELYIVADAAHYMPEENVRNRVFAVNLDHGEFVGLWDDTEVTPVKNAKVVVKSTNKGK